MKTILRFAVVLVLGVSVCQAAPSKKEALAAIVAVEADPFSDTGRDAAKVVVEFADESGEVAIALNSQVVPWAFEKAPRSDAREDVETVLVAVYIAGNVKAQIAAGRAKDDPYAGWLAVIRLYPKLQKERKIAFPSIERLAALEDQGKLKEHASNAAKAK
jgi:hypothetical protein